MRMKVLAVLLMAATLTACGGGTSSKTGAKNEKVSNKDKENASAIIEYTNKIVDYTNEVNGWLRSNGSKIDDMLTSVEQQRWMNIMPFTPSPMIQHKDKGLDTPPTVMEEEDQTYFKEFMTNFRATFASYQENCTKLQKYIRNQDYKDDNFAKGKELAETIVAERDEVYSSMSAMHERREEIASAAEYIILADYPLRDAIFTLREEMANFDELRAIFVYYNDGETTVEQADSAYQAVFASVEANRGLYTEVLEEFNKQGAYNSFYKDCDDALDTYRFALRTYVKAARQIPTSELGTFRTRSNSLVSDYNSFVN